MKGAGPASRNQELEYRDVAYRSRHQFWELDAVCSTHTIPTNIDTTRRFIVPKRATYQPSDRYKRIRSFEFGELSLLGIKILLLSFSK